MIGSILFRNWLRGVVAVLVVAGVGVGLGACGSDASDESTQDASVGTTVADTMTVSHVLKTDDRFSTLVAGLDSTGLDSTLASEGPYTLFAPTNDAFSALPEGTTEALLSEYQDRLRAILTHHVAEERISTTSVADSQQVAMMSGDTLLLRASDAGVTLGEGRVVDGDIEVSNGLIHVIDHVLPPPSNLSSP